MNIGLFTSVYFNNIGNGFIDLGAEQEIMEAMPGGAKLVKISQCANFAASMSKSFAIKENPIVNWAWVHLMQKFASKVHDKSYQAINTLDVFSPASMFKLDYLIIPGCVLTVPFVTIYGKLLEKKKEEGCKIVFLGASGNFYTEYEVKIVSEFLKKLQPYAIMTRDSEAYKYYKDLSERSYNGIDNVFFVNRLNIPRLDSDIGSYCVVNIEEPKHEKLKNEIICKLEQENKKIVLTNHKPYPYSKIGKMVKDGRTVISDYPLDYLAIYRNVDTVYSDRVHACIPTLSFGNKAVLYTDSPRKALFENVGLDFSSQEPISIKGLSELQEGQIDFLQKLLK